MRTRTTAIACLSCLSVLVGPAVAQERQGVHLELPVFDTSWNAGGGHPVPSMQQSLWLATDAYQLLHYGLSKVWDPYDERSPLKAGLGMGLVGAADILLMVLPPGLAWQHEEWHRAVLSNRRVQSRNDVYDFNLFASTVYVSHVSDEGLARLKAESPSEFVRMSTAGIEANYELATNLEKVQFFYRTRTWNVPSLWYLYLTNQMYMMACAGRTADTMVHENNRLDGANVAKRDFTGADCTSWTYDLFHPDEPYAARGIHPSGVGINRYRAWSDLTGQEQDTLRTQRNLSLLNFLDPGLIGFDSFTTAGLRWNAHVRYLPAPFGNTLGVEGFFHRGAHNLMVVVNAHGNHDRWWPGISAELLRYALVRGQGGTLWLSARLAGWLQPEQQRFFSTSAQPGGLAGMRLGWGATRLAEPFLEFDAKSEGFVPGQVALSSAFSARIGLVSRPF